MISQYGVKGFKFHPSVQEFSPNDRMAYPLYEVIAEPPFEAGADQASATLALPALALVSELTLDDLDACAGFSGRWARSGIHTPLLLPEDEFRKSLDAFPLE